MSEIVLENLLIAYLWKLTRESYYKPNTKSGRASRGSRNKIINEQYEFLQSAITKLSEEFQTIKNDKIDTYVNNQLNHFYGQTLDSDEIHKELKQKIKSKIDEKNKLNLISEILLDVYKDVLYEVHFGNKKMQIQKTTLDSVKSKSTGYRNFFTNEPANTFWNRKKNYFIQEDDEIKINFKEQSGLNKKNFNYLLMRRYYEGYPVFLIGNFEGNSIKEYIYRLPKNSQLNNKLESVILNSELKSEYEKFISELKRLKIFKQRKITDQARINKRKLELRNYIDNQNQRLDSLNYVNFNKIKNKEDIEREKQKSMEEKQKISNEIDSVNEDLNRLKAIEQHIIQNKNTRDIEVNNVLLSSLGFYIRKSRETEDNFDKILKNSGIQFKAYDRKTIKSLNSKTYLEIDRVLNINGREIYIEISDPQHFTGSTYIVKRDQNKITSIVQNKVFPFIYISYDCLDYLDKVNDIKYFLEERANESVNNEKIIELYQQNTISKYVGKENLKLFKMG